MLKITSSLRPTRWLLLLALTTILIPDSTKAAGISIDAGLTPAKGRWMGRTQVRYMHRENDLGMMEMKMRMHPLVVAHGLRSDLTLMARLKHVNREKIKMGNSTTTSGLDDLLLLAKYRLLRKNTATYTLGIAPTLGIELPIGEKGIGSDSYDLHVGCFLSARRGKWGMDLNLKYVWNGLALTDGNELDPGDELVIETAFDHRFGLGSNAQYSIAPVIESSFLKTTADSQNSVDITNTGESVWWFSPGLIFTRSSFFIEVLARIPIWQNQTGSQTEHKPGFIIGVRLMN